MVMVGSSLKQREQQYVAHRDERGTWRILNTWHKDLENVSPDDEISDTSPAIIVVSEGAFIALIKEATAQGILENASVSGNKFNDFELEKEKLEKDGLKTENEKLKNVNESLRSELGKKEPTSEAFKMKAKVLDALMKLAISEDISEFKKE